ncbi:cobyrinate a,c-diamide synthase [Alkalinema sp. FACHB-956]|uniref:cobyrinate a,c-diamide synthase n=1 Tax=Alkalinema sp. FACHB-956 TaxID=2692768 RepID=UPI001684C3EB|nr:cobyrinate a,c-diamide synthase [Alkalinema sp. FACHB-956]MBD2326409.1 cobyrinate a,c-diamide synthase [Alkalinema sp. FACHB-956]
MGVIIAGDRSGSGKTTVTLAMLAALRQKQLAVQSFKVGPDYIDPMFHRAVTGRACYNLDPVLTSETYVRQSYGRRSQAIPHSIVEGVMGLFDGAAAPQGYGSTAHVAKVLGLPVVLVVNCRSVSQSIAALVQGYRTFDPAVNVAGLVLNQVGSDRHLELLMAALEPLNLPIVGVLRREDQIHLPDRHLGLVPTAELPQLTEILDRLAVLGLRCFDWEKLLPLVENSPLASSIEPSDLPEVEPLPQPVRLAIAQDPAFSFYYADNLELLTALGAELVPWSPLRDGPRPDCQGLYFGGGFPEMFAAELADNAAARQAVGQAIAQGLPTYGECGGLMYLCQAIVDFEGQRHAMVGTLPTDAVMGKRLTLGYREATVQATSALVQAGQRLRGHEFHRSQVTGRSAQPLFHLRSLQVTPARSGGSQFPFARSAQQNSEQQHSETPATNPLEGQAEGWAMANLHASYLHLHWGTTPDLPRRFLQRCLGHSPS